MIENLQQQTPDYLSHPRNLRWDLRWAIPVMLMVLLSACQVGEPPTATPRHVTLWPTFTPTVASMPVAASVTVTSGITPTVVSPTRQVANTDAAALPGETMPVELLTVTTTITTTIAPTPTIVPTPTTQLISAPMLTPTVSPTDVASSLPVVEPNIYIVQTGDTLSRIAQQHQTTVDTLKMVNSLTTDLIQVGQRLTISNTAPPLAIVPMTAPPVASAPLQTFSILEGDLATAYPLTIARERFTLHYSPNPMPAQPPELLADIIDRALLHHEQMLQVTLDGRFDAYVAGSPFAPPDQSLRGHSYSADRFFVFLDDGSGNLDDLTYLIGHELTHMFVWLIFGRPTDPMLSEGAAVYVGMDFIGNTQHIPITPFCAAYDQIGELPWVSAKLTYKGHMRDLENYYAAGCFVKYLIETYGVEKFGYLYPSNDYIGIYGKTLAQLDTEWHAAVTATPISVPFDAFTFVQFVERLKAAHTTLFNTFTGTAEQMKQYRALDQVRMALLEGRLADVQRYFGQ